MSREEDSTLGMLRLVGALVEAVMTIQEITDFQTHPPRLLIKGENFIGPECKTKGPICLSKTS